LTKKRICLVDDDPTVRDALRLGLEDAGYVVFTAAGGEAALQLLQREPVAAVLTDMRMPGFDGGKLIAALRAQHPALPIVAMSGGGEINGQDVSVLARANGADECLIKPFRGRDIAAALKRLLQTDE
jgi:DNA-binding response OmpR family regulator